MGLLLRAVGGLWRDVLDQLHANWSILLLGLAGVWLTWVNTRARQLADFKETTTAEFQHLKRRERLAQQRAAITGSAFRLIDHLPPFTLPRESFGPIRRRERARTYREDKRPHGSLRWWRLWRRWQLSRARRRDVPVHHIACALFFGKPDLTFDLVLVWESAGSVTEAINRVIGMYGYNAVTEDAVQAAATGSGRFVLQLDADSYVVVEELQSGPSKQRKRARSTAGIKSF